MKQTTFQHPELRDANDNIIQQGAFGKNTALANSTNDGWIDYVANDLEALYNNTMGGTGGEINTETITGKTGTITNLTATTVKADTLTADALTVSGETSVPTANAGNSSKAIANTEFVAKSIASLVNGAPDQLNTLNEMAKALGNDSNFAATVTAELAKKLNSTEAESTYLPLSGGTLTGVVNGVTPTAGDNSTKIATTEFVNAKAGNYLPLSGGTVTGDLTVTGALDGTASGNLPLSGGNITGDLSVTGTITGNVTGNVTGNADTATNATNDANGNPIASTYLPAVVGVVQAFAGSTIPTGWLLCDGSAVSRTNYAALYAVIGTTYGAGDGSTTFNLPNLVDKFVEGSATAGTVKSAGLPNITGAFGLRPVDGGLNVTWETNNGAVKATTLTGDNSSCVAKSSSFSPLINVTIDASRSSAIYGKSDTVQPPALTMRYIIKY